MSPDGHDERDPVLAAIQALLASPADRETIMQLAVAWGQAVTGAERASLVEVEGESIVVRAGSGLVAHRIGDRLPLRESLMGRCAIIAATQRCDDAETDPRVAHHAIRAGGIRSMLAVPLIEGARMQGVLTVMSPRPAAFGKRQTEALLLVSAPVGPLLALANATDATRRAEQEIAAAARLKSQFLQTISHELRTPLTTIIGYLALLQDPRNGVLTNEQRHDLAGIGGAAESLLTLIDDLLLLARLEAGTVLLQPETVQLRDLIATVMAEFEPAATAKGLAITIDVASGMLVTLDRLVLSRLLHALIDNAVRLTAHGGIAISVRLREGALALTVSDTGLGTASQNMPHVGTTFWQGNEAMKRPYGGIGIGLVMARRLSEVHGGDFTMRSDPGHGSAFTVQLPIALD